MIILLKHRLAVKCIVLPRQLSHRLIYRQLTLVDALRFLYMPHLFFINRLSCRKILLSDTINLGSRESVPIRFFKVDVSSFVIGDLFILNH